MKTDGFTYEVGMFVNFTDDELRTIWNCCVAHYDGLAKSSAQQGGFLYGWFNMRRMGAAAISCSFGQLDTCAKALEQPPQGEETEQASKARWDLRADIMKILRSLNEKTASLSADPSVEQ